MTEFLKTAGTLKKSSEEITSKILKNTDVNAQSWKINSELYWYKRKNKLKFGPNYFFIQDSFNLIVKLIYTHTSTQTHLSLLFNSFKANEISLFFTPYK